MTQHFSGCWNLEVTARIPDAAEYGAAVRFVIQGADEGDGTYLAGLGLKMSACGSAWTLQAERVDRFTGNWVDALTQVTVGPFATIIGVNDDTPPEQRFDDVVLTCTAWVELPVPASLRHSVPVIAESTWVSWGVKVDGGGPSGRGPIPPWGPHVRSFAAGLALAEVAGLVSSELRYRVLELAAKQVSEAAAGITKLMTSKESR